MLNALSLLVIPVVLCPVGVPEPVTGVDSSPLAASAAVPSLSQALPSFSEFVRDSSLEEVYGAALPWQDFLAGADARRDIWERNWEAARIPPELFVRARATGSLWRILAITEAGCSDSVSTIPYIARLAAELETLELRVVDSTVGRPWMEAHRSPDGRPATPTVLVLDEEYRIRGCWIEQPVGVQEFWLDVVARGTMEQEVGRKFAWYEEDEGRETLRELVEVLEGARDGTPICPGLES
jgi:hypothetical protein